MKKIFFVLLFLSLYSAAFSQLVVQNAFPGLTFNQCVFLTHAGDGTNRIFVVEKPGTIRVFANDSNATSSSIFLNVTNLISTNYTEKGLLGLAFHPNYSSNRFFYIYYTRLSDGALTIARFTTQAGNPNKADSLSQLILLTIPHPTNLNHNGGMLMFGADGYLYAGHGDGGSGGDPPNNAQNVNVLLGKITRIDVNNPSGGNNYGIPPTNPFASGGGSPEIFCWGMRNPWRFSQDPVTHIIFCGDVGQDAYEEVDTIVVGHNYGWRIMEGYNCYNPPSGCNMAGLTLPIRQYTHANSACSITGGYVYRGSRVPSLVGRYIYGDYCNRGIWKLLYNAGNVSDTALISSCPQAIQSFGIDQNNELYICGTTSVYRFQSVVIGVNGNGETTPEGFTLEQNYPNPFNPATTISYSIPKTDFVTVKIYNMLGEEVQLLVNETKTAGQYKATWDASNYPSGVYFYKLTAGSYAAEKKMVLIK